LADPSCWQPPDQGPVVVGDDVAVVLVVETGADEEDDVFAEPVVVVSVMFDVGVVVPSSDVVSAADPTIWSSTLEVLTPVLRHTFAGPDSHRDSPVLLSLTSIYASTALSSPDTS
jgi:hypothetical protein